MSAAATVPSSRTRAKTRVLIAAEQGATRAGVRLALAPIAICSEASDASSAIDMAVRERPDVCLLEMNMPGRGLTAAAEISSRLPSSAIVMLTHNPDESEFFESIRAGASGYLPDQIDPKRLPHVVTGVLRGEAAIPRRLVAKLIDEMHGRERRRQILLHQRRKIDLTRREWEVLELLRERRSTQEIARILAISEVTVRRHISALLKKLEVSDREEAIRLIESDEG